ncbi:hypothetical protein CEP52_008076 [Fusarium oligoseptatum]|uniref:CCHC-type domain-containing protein n=1 Tax=Fusarium oligoseptatum TaxID=2604345 RepID=A0A428TJQ3_9HYPO|nr:hypothetical protein CEP52_008076 [Fusarium oligoseptatum]
MPSHTPPAPFLWLGPGQVAQKPPPPPPLRGLNQAYSFKIKVENSYANDINARYNTQLLVELYRSETLMDARDAKLTDKSRVRRPSVLILTHYSVQKNAYQLLLRNMSVAEIPKELVDVRTVDDSHCQCPSHEADIVVIDTVRTGRAGFTGEAERMAVMMTRARIGTILIGPGANVKLNAPQENLKEYTERHRAIVDESGDKLARWDIFCDNCVQPGHTADRCPKSPSCRTCKGAPHSTRACPRASEDAITIWLADKIKADDGIERTVARTANVGPSGGKRVKKNKSDRNQQFAKPGKKDDDNAFKRTLRAARQEKPASDDEDDEA